MKDTFLNAKLVQPDLIRLVVFSSLSWERIEPTLIVDGVAKRKMTPTRLNTLSTLAIADFRLEKPLELGHSYFLCMPQYGSVSLDVNEAVDFEGFDEQFAYDGDDLGATYTKKATRFAIWAPLASKVVVSYRDKKSDAFTPVNMIRGEKGVFRATIPGDHEGAEYHYYITNSEVSHRTPDPYAKASTTNAKESVVVDFDKLKVDFHRECLPICQSYSDAVIYETHVRDFTISPDTDIVHKGTFLGMVEKGRKSRGGNPAGLDHLLALGVTHVQLLPIYDYKTVDEENPSSGYNWGYDPYQYFVPEGSYASVLRDPISRIRDCKAMVAAFHQAGIRVVMDVVYNHVFEYEKSTFERVVPNYYFRHRGTGKMANTSGCGDDLASERPMVRRLIVDSAKWWIDVYGIDGFRFDLMGIVDVDTLKEISAYGLMRHKSFIVYGEGWNMGGEVKVPLGHMGNYQMLPEYGFFNDFFRESLKEYFVGNRDVTNNVKNVLCGSCVDFLMGAKFLTANQTINYVECHDNGTIFDHFERRRGDLPLQERLKLVESINAAVLFALGIPFIHMGQEFGQTKHGEDNTYNKGDYYNMFDYRVYDERIDMVKRLSQAISLRKKLRCFHIFDPRVIGPAIAVDNVGDAIRFSFVEENIIAPRKEICVYINASENDIDVPVTQGTISLFGPGEFKQTEEGVFCRLPARSTVLLERN